MQLWEIVAATALGLPAVFYGIKGAAITGSITIQAARRLVSRTRR